MHKLPALYQNIRNAAFASIKFGTNTIKCRTISNKQPSITLSNGQQMPVIGLGTWRSYESEAEKAVSDAIDIGYRHIDTAFTYENEHEVGQAIKTKIAEGIIKREDMFVVTKLGGIHHEPKLVQHACCRSLKQLNLDYIDLYLMHFPVGQVYTGDANVRGTFDFTNVDYLDTWRAMEALVDLGLVRGIGLSNFNAAQTQRILDNARIKPLVNQVECHPGFNQQQLIEFSHKRNVYITAYCPLARPNPEQKWPDFLYDDKAQSLAQKYGKTTAQVCLRYLLQLGVVVIPKSVSKTRIAENFNILDFELSAEDMQLMNAYHTGKRINPFAGMEGHKYYPFHAQF